MAGPATVTSAVNTAAKEATRETPASLKGDLTAAGILSEAIEEAGFSGEEALADAEVDDDLEDADEAPSAEDEAAAAELVGGAEKKTEEETTEGDKKPAEETEKPAETPKASDTEEITANGVKITIDYSDRAAIKRAHEKAAGVDKLYARYKEQRDELRTAAKATEDVTTKAAQMDHLSGLYGEGDEQGFYNLLNHLSGGKAKEVAAKIAGLPEPRTQAPNYEAELTKLRAEIADGKKQTELASAQAAIDGVFPQFSFTGKLGDPHAEHEMDELIFTRFQNLYSKAEAEGKKLTSDAVKQLMTEATKAVPQAVHKAARALLAERESGTAAAAKAAAQAAASPAKAGSATSSSSGKKKKSESQINWLNPQDITQFLEDGLA